MRLLSRFVLSTLTTAGLLGLMAAPAAHAFVNHTLDPTGPPSSGTTYYITSNNFNIYFTPCAQNELPNGLTAEGCFAGVNRSGEDWTSLQYVFNNNSALKGQPADCTLAPSDNIFQRPNCTFNASLQKYFLDYAGGVLANNATFFITEDGVDPAQFGVGQATVTSYTSANSPEPAPFVLLGTGLLLIGWVATHRSA